MRLMHLLIAASVLGWIGCGGAPPGDASSTTAVTDDHGHDHEATDHAQDDTTTSTAATTSGSDPAQPTEASATPELGESANDSEIASTASPAETPPDQEPEPATPPVGDVGSTGLAAHHAATTRVGPGDELPALTVTDLEGNEVSVRGLQEGAKVLVLVFWDSQTDLAKLELEYLQKEIADPRNEQGVRVVAINRGDTAEVVRQVVQEHGVRFPVLVDADASAFGKMATRTVPRTYVVDSEGRVRNLWIGFTGQGTISEIQKEIDAALSES